jgi:signal transduction histidine kinase
MPVKVLNVDDRDENRYLLEAMLRGDGHAVVSVTNGVEALDRLSREKFDLIISDVLMPQMDGFQLCREVKRRKDTKDIPFIFYTATYTDRKDRELALSLGASRFIIKPTEPEQFVEVVREVLREHERGEAPPPRPPVESESEYLRVYNERLVQKLEHKVNQLQDAVRARDEFLSVASHELRTPITSLLLAVQSLRSGVYPDCPPEEMRLFEVAEEQCQRLARLIDQLLDVTRIRAGRLHLDLAPVDLVEVARDAMRRHVQELAASRSSLELRADAPVVGLWDRSRLDQAACNLLGNAIKFGGGNPIVMGVEAAGKKARLWVADHGIGIAGERVETIFEPFERAVSVREYGGLGLGLYIVRRVVEAHGGTVRVESNGTRGSKFVVELPLAGPS